MGSYIPADVRRVLRQESNYGCAKCGAPIIDYHHIIPRSERDHNDPEHMVALCPNHHRPADDGAIPRSELYELKKSPHNRGQVDYFFNFDSGQPRFEMGELDIVIGEGTQHSIIQIAQKSMLSMAFKGGILTFDMAIHNQGGEKIAEISHNEWRAITDRVWDLEYKSNELALWDPNEELRLKLSYDPARDRVKFEAKFYYNGVECKILPSKIETGTGATIQGSGEIILSGQRSGTLFYMNENLDGIAMGVH